VAPAPVADAMGGMVLWGRAAGGLDGERKRSARLLLLLLLWLMQGLLVVLVLWLWL